MVLWFSMAAPKSSGHIINWMNINYISSNNITIQGFIITIKLMFVFLIASRLPKHYFPSPLRGRLAPHVLRGGRYLSGQAKGNTSALQCLQPALQGSRRIPHYRGNKGINVFRAERLQSWQGARWHRSNRHWKIHRYTININYKIQNKYTIIYKYTIIHKYKK